MTERLEPLIKLLFPVSCLECEREGSWLCQNCLATLPEPNLHRCVLCGKAGQNGLCEKCQKWSGLRGVCSFYAYKEKLAQKIIKTGKYAGRFDALRFIAKANARKVRRFIPSDVEYFACVPLHRHKETERGYNQADIFAAPIVRGYFEPFAGLKRIINAAPQASLAKEDRLKNLVDAFECKRAAPEKIVLFDDVITTGATLKAAAKALKKAGCKEVWAVTIAHG